MISLFASVEKDIFEPRLETDPVKISQVDELNAAIMSNSHPVDKLRAAVKYSEQRGGHSVHLSQKLAEDLLAYVDSFPREIIER